MSSISPCSLTRERLWEEACGLISLLYRNTSELLRRWTTNNPRRDSEYHVVAAILFGVASAGPMLGGRKRGTSYYLYRYAYRIRRVPGEFPVLKKANAVVSLLLISPFLYGWSAFAQNEGRTTAGNGPDGVPQTTFVEHRLGTDHAEGITVLDMNGDGRPDLLSGA